MRTKETLMRGTIMRAITTNIMEMATMDTIEKVGPTATIEVMTTAERMTILTIMTMTTTMTMTMTMTILLSCPRGEGVRSILHFPFPRRVSYCTHTLTGLLTRHRWTHLCIIM